LLEEYEESRNWISLMLKIEPNNAQALALRSVIEDKIRKGMNAMMLESLNSSSLGTEGLIGIAILGGVAAIVGTAAIVTARILKK